MNTRKGIHALEWSYGSCWCESVQSLACWDHDGSNVESGTGSKLTRSEISSINRESQCPYQAHGIDGELITMREWSVMDAGSVVTGHVGTRGKGAPQS